MRRPIFRMVTCTLLMTVAFLAALIAPPSRTYAGSLSTSVIGLFPKEVGEFAYADLKAARSLPWFGQLREQLLPSRFRQFEQFLTSAGIDPNAQVDELAWAGITVPKTNGEEIVGVALGSFDPSTAEAHFKMQKMPMIEVRGYHLYAFGSGVAANDILFFFIDSNTAAFGHRPALEKMIDVRAGVADNLLTNDKIYPLMSETNGKGLIWAVLDQSYTHLAMTQLLPQATQFPQAAAIINRLHAMTITVQADTSVDARFQAVCDSVDDANTLGAAMQAGIMYERYQEQQSNPALSTLLDGVRVTPSGDRLKIDAPVSQDQLLTLIRTHAFAVPI
jgi:hypothetical protein